MQAKKKILVVDDDVAISEFVCEALQMAGYEVECVHDGAQAMESLGRFRPDAILMDVVMPRENGYRVSRRIKEQSDTGGAKVLLLTGRCLRSDPDREALFLEFSRADGVLYKPFALHELQQQVHSLLAA